MKELLYYSIFAIILYFLLSAVFENFYLEQENFDPSLVPVSSIVTLAKVAQKLVNGNGTLTNPGNLQIGGASGSSPGNLTVTGNTTINGSKSAANKVNFRGSGAGQSLYSYLKIGNISMGDGWGTDTNPNSQDIINAPNLLLTSNNESGVGVLGDFYITGSGKQAPSSFSFGQTSATVRANIGTLKIGTTGGGSFDVIQGAGHGNQLLIGSQVSGGTTQIWNNNLTVDKDANIKGILTVDTKLKVGRIIISENENFFTTITAENIFSTGALSNSSDIRLKTNIEPLTDVLSSIKQLNGVKFNYKKNPDDKKSIGLIAQDVEKVFPEVVSTQESDEKLKSIAYPNLVAVLIEGMKEQQKIIEDLQANVKMLMARLP
jgi:hypothetical protein